MKPCGVVVGLVLAGQMGYAQSHVTSPTGYLYMEGETGAAHHFGSLPNARVMFFDGEYIGSRITIREIAYRPDYRKHATLARRWSNVTLSMSECDMGSLFRTFSQNPVTTPTRVFSGPTAWPALTGFPARRPASFNLRFPFSAPWVLTGKHGICADYKFAGSWSGLGPYPLDTYGGLGLGGGRYSVFGYGFYDTRGCLDSQFRWYGPRGSYCFITAKIHGPSDPIPRYRNQIEVNVGSHYTAASRPVIVAVGTAGFDNGFALPGLSCERLYVDISKPTVFHYVANSWKFGSVVLPPFFIPYRMGDTLGSLWAQSAWNDSTTGRLKLSGAMRVEIGRAPIHRLVLSAGTTNARVGGGPFAVASVDAICRYTL